MKDRPKLLDLFCGAGGAAMGYHRAGFDVVGVDIKPQPHFPFEFIQADAMTYPLDGFDVIHASPPCQAYSISRNNGACKGSPDLLGAVRQRLIVQAPHWVIENVPGAPMPGGVQVCGAAFGLSVLGRDLPRHRWFESSSLLLVPQCQHKRGSTIGVYGHGTNKWHRDKFGHNLTADMMREAMGIDWMSRDELSQAIPPAYTEYIGKLIMDAL